VVSGIESSAVERVRGFGFPSLPLTIVRTYDNLRGVAYTVEYFHARVQAEINSWPDGTLADFARLVELLMEFGPHLRMPHSRAMGQGLFELRARGKEGVGRALYCFVRGHRVVILHAFMKKTRATPSQALEIARQRLKEVENG
jgi:phage-related protein